MDPIATGTRVRRQDTTPLRAQASIRTAGLEGYRLGSIAK